jgi:hypothetical protein
MVGARATLEQAAREVGHLYIKGFEPIVASAHLNSSEGIRPKRLLACRNNYWKE